MSTKHLLRLLILVSFGFLAHCGETEDADTRAVSFTHNPSNPVIIDAPNYTYYIPGSGPDATPIKVVVPGPYYFSIPIFTNNSQYPLVIATIKYSIRGASAAGAVIEHEASLDPGDKTVNSDSSTTNDEPYVDFIPPGTTTVNNTRWIMGGLPTREEVGGNLAFTVHLEAIGWFGLNGTTPTDVATPLLNPLKSFRKLHTIRIAQ